MNTRGTRVVDDFNNWTGTVTEIDPNNPTVVFVEWDNGKSGWYNIFLLSKI